MALFIRQDDNRTELQERIAAELQEKARKRAQDGNNRPDGVNDSQYVKGTKTTTSLAGVWIIIALVIIAAFIFFMSVSHR